MRVTKAATKLKLQAGESKGRRHAGGLIAQASSRLIERDGVLSIDGLDAAIRGFGVATVVALSLLGYGRVAGARLGVGDLADPVGIAFGLVLYNLLVITALGVPLRRPPTFPLFLLDWSVATVAVLLTGGFLSPFIILYYALGIGAALRVGLRRSMLLVALCAAVYTALSVASRSELGAAKLPVLVVEITSLCMVVLTAVALKNAFRVEAQRVQLEKQSANQLRLLNSLINTVLSASPDLEKVMRTVASVSSEAIGADSGLAVLFSEQVAAPNASGQLVESRPLDGEMLLVAGQEPDPPHLSHAEEELLSRAVALGAPVVTGGLDEERQSDRSKPFYPGLERAGQSLCTVACVPFLMQGVQGGVIGALFVGKYDSRPFSQAEITLLTAIGSQMAVAVRLARLYEMERDKAVRSEEREKLERDLLSMVSHELRTPLTSIKTCVGALGDMSPTAGATTGTQARLVQNIERSTDRLIGLVNELLDMARLRAGRVSLQMQQVNLGAVITDMAGQVAPLLEARPQKLLLDLPPAASTRWRSLIVQADRRRIEQVLINLISNANKYAPPGSVITMGATPRGDGVQVFVRDEGPGLARQEHARVFEKFYTVPADGAQEGQGQGTRTESIGLGLAIARSIVELHGGTIGVQSRQGHGSLFFFTLPYEQMECDEPVAAGYAAQE